MLYCGLRSAEVLGLNVTDADIGGWWVQVTHSLKRHREAATRREVIAQDVTFRIRLGHSKVRSSGGAWTDHKGQTNLIVRSEVFEVSAASPVLRVISGKEYYFRAPEITIELGLIPSLVHRENWIVVSGPESGKPVQLALAIASNSNLSGVRWTMSR
jgi:hypothetical protein